MIFFINPASTEIHLGLSLICDLWLLNKNSIQLNWNLKKLLPFCPCHFVRTILSVPFCPIPFCPVTLWPCHFVQYNPMNRSKSSYLKQWSVVVCVQPPKQTKESARRDDHMFLLFGCGPYVSIVALDHMFLLCGRRPYVSIVCDHMFLTICFYCVTLGHMFLLCALKTYVSIFSIKTIWSPLQWNRWLVT